MSRGPGRVMRAVVAILEAEAEADRVATGWPEWVDLPRLAVSVEAGAPWPPGQHIAPRSLTESVRRAVTNLERNGTVETALVLRLRPSLYVASRWSTGEPATYSTTNASRYVVAARVPLTDDERQAEADLGRRRKAELAAALGRYGAHFAGICDRSGIPRPPHHHREDLDR